MDEWSFTVQGAVDEPVSWPWEKFLELPSEALTVDIHCVTKWTKLDTTWRGVSVDTLLSDIDTEAEYVTAWSDGGYTTNLALEDATDGRAWVAYEYNGDRSIQSTGTGAPPGAASLLLEERKMESPDVSVGRVTAVVAGTGRRV